MSAEKWSSAELLGGGRTELFMESCVPFSLAGSVGGFWDGKIALSALRAW